MNGKQLSDDKKQLTIVSTVLVSPQLATEASTMAQLQSVALESKDLSTSDNSDLKLSAISGKQSRIPQRRSSIRVGVGKRFDKTGKEVRVRFRDTTPQGQLSEVIEVESYKEYNIIQPTDPTGCTCSLL